MRKAGLCSKQCASNVSLVRRAPLFNDFRDVKHTTLSEQAAVKEAEVIYIRTDASSNHLYENTHVPATVTYVSRSAVSNALTHRAKRVVRPKLISRQILRFCLLRPNSIATLCACVQIDIHLLQGVYLGNRKQKLLWRRQANSQV